MQTHRNDIVTVHLRLCRQWVCDSTGSRLGVAPEVVPMHGDSSVDAQITDQCSDATLRSPALSKRCPNVRARRTEMSPLASSRRRHRRHGKRADNGFASRCSAVTADGNHSAVGVCGPGRRRVAGLLQGCAEMPGLPGAPAVQLRWTRSLRDGDVITAAKCFSA